MKSKTSVALTVMVPALLAAMLVVAACGGGNSTTTTTAAPVKKVAEPSMRESLRTTRLFQCPRQERQAVATTEQEAFWEGGFGDDYVDRNQGAQQRVSSLAFWARVFRRQGAVEKVLELGSNIGLNMMAIRQLLPNAKLSAVEINKKAASELETNVPGIDLHAKSILEFEPSEQWDLVFTSGVLIHINPERLTAVYDLMYRVRLATF